MSFAKFLTQRFAEGLVVVLLILFMPSVPPDVTFSDSYRVAVPRAFEGKLALNERLSEVEIWHKGDLNGPEAFDDYNGELYTCLHGGDVVKLTGNHITPVVKFGKPCKGIYQEAICGRPLGLQFDRNGALFVADAYYGIFKVDVKTGEKVKLVSFNEEIGGKKVKLPNSVAVASNGDLYWSDSSTDFSLEDGAFDLLADGSGRLIHYDGRTGHQTVLIDKVHFANGVILADDESFVLVSETARSRILRYYLKGPKKGTYDVFIDGLPGYTDNLNTDGKDGFLVPLVTPSDKDHPAVTQSLGPFPLLRKFIARTFGLVELGFKIIHQIYPNEYAERGMHFIGHFSSMSFMMPPRVTIVHLSKNGEILDSVHTMNKKISGISEAHIFRDTLYLGSPYNDYIGRIPLTKIGWDHLKQEKARVRSAPTTTTPKPTTTTTTPKPTTTKPKPTTPKPATTTTAKPKPTTTTAKPTTRPTSTTAKPTTTSKPITTTEQPTTRAPTTTPKSTPKTTTQSDKDKSKTVPTKESQKK